MHNMSDSTRETNVDEQGKYQSIEYTGSTGTITIIQDRENDKAWIQSNQPMEVQQ